MVATTLRAAMPNTCICEWNWNYFFWMLETLTPAIAVGVAVWGATSWRRQQRTTKRAEIAGQTLVATQRFVSAMEYVASPALMKFGKGETSVPSEYKGESAEERAVELREHRARMLGKDLDHRWEQIKPDEQNFHTSWELARVYLPPPATEVLKRIWLKRADIASSQVTVVDTVHYGRTDEPLAAAARERAFGAKVRDEVVALRDEALAAIGPLARLDEG